jgi:hypothetical protein
MNQFFDWLNCTCWQADDDTCGKAGLLCCINSNPLSLDFGCASYICALASALSVPEQLVHH